MRITMQPSQLMWTHDRCGRGMGRWDLYRAEGQRLAATHQGPGGGDLCRTQATRVSKRSTRARISSTLEGQTLRRDAFRVLSFYKVETFEKFGHSLAVAA